MGDEEAPGHPDLATPQAIAEDMAMIEGMDDEAAAYHASAALYRALDEGRGGAATLRARMASRLRDARKLSLAGLAEFVGVSRSRAQQLVKPNRGDDAT